MVIPFILLCELLCSLCKENLVTAVNSDKGPNNIVHTEKQALTFGNQVIGEKKNTFLMEESRMSIKQTTPLTINNEQ